MQRSRNGRRAPSGKRRGGVALALLLVAALIGVGVLAVQTFQLSGSTGVVTAAKLSIPESNIVQPFGPYVLYYDDMSIHCLNDTGGVRWSYQIGDGAGFSAGENVMAAWSGSQIYLFDLNGHPTYNDNLSDNIQFARVGRQYVAAVTGDDTASRLLVKDHTGAHMDEEADAYDDLLVLDVGFYGGHGEYMWTLALDIFGTAANTILNTFEVGKMNTGEISLGEPITYAVLYENGKLRVVNTRTLRTFNYRGTEDTGASMLVYGWRMIGSEIPEKGDALMLFGTSSETVGQYAMTELRLLSTSIDKRYSLPTQCVGAVVRNRQVYAIGPNAIYRASVTDNRFTSFPLPLKTGLTRVIGTLSTGKVLARGADGAVYVITLP